MIRDRRAVTAFIVATLIIGLVSTMLRGRGLPYPIAKGVPDALYTVLIYGLVLFVRPRIPVLHAALWSALLSDLVEVSQLYQRPWIDAIRATTLGGLVLGHGFHATDMIWYAAGALFAALVDQRLLARAGSSPASRTPG